MMHKIHPKGRTSKPPSERAKKSETLLRPHVSKLLGILNVRRKELYDQQMVIERVAKNIRKLRKYSVEGISLSTGISRGTVSTIRERAEITDRKEELGKFSWMEGAVEVLVSLLRGEKVNPIAKRLNKGRQNVHTIMVNAISAGFVLDPLSTITAKPRGNNKLMKALFMLFEGKDPEVIAVKLKVCMLGVQVLETIAKRKKLFALRPTKHKSRSRKATNKG